jgi:hypothetical protein
VYIIEEYLTFDEWLAGRTAKERPLSEQEFVALSKALLEALLFLENSHLHHCAFGPTNIVLQDG